MKRAILIFLVVVALLTMAQECQTGDSEGTKDKVNPYVGGTAGLSIQFGEGNPPDEVFDRGQYPFDIEVKLLNVGEADIKKENVKVTVTGLNPSDFNKPESFFIKNGIEEDILATYKDFEGNIIKPSDTFVTFPGLNFIDTLTGNFQTKVRADVCYTYKTETASDGCIRKDVLSVDKNSVCQVSESKTVYNSGAPIQVDKFEELPSGTDKVRYLFTIKHLGSGNVYSPGSKCPIDRTAQNKIHFKIESSVTDLLCSGLVEGTAKEGYVILREGEQTIRCVQQTTSQLDFLDRIKITLDYDYGESIDKTFLIKKSS
jgi:hypothetical protein